MNRSSLLKRLILGLVMVLISSFLTVGVSADVNLFDNDTYKISQDIVDASKKSKTKTRKIQGPEKPKNTKIIQGPEKPKDLKNQQTPQQRKDDATMDMIKNGTPATEDVVSMAKKAEEEKKAEETFDGTYEDAMNHLDLITSKVWFGNDVLGMNSETMYLINTLIQGVFWVAKMIFYVCALVYEKLSDTSSLDPYVTMSLDSGRTLFNILKNDFGFVAIILGTAYAYYDYALKKGSFFRNIMKMVVTIACSFMLFSQYNGKYVVQHVTDNAFTISQEISTKVVDGLSTTLTESTNVNTSSLSGKDKQSVLTQYFNKTIWQAFKYMNAESTVKDGKTTFTFSEEQFRELIFYPSGDGDFKVGDKKIKNIVGSKDKVKNQMMKDAWGKKTMYAVTAIVDTLVLGLILDAFALFSFVSILLIMVLILLGAFVALLALFPKAEGFLIGWFRKFGTTIFVSSLATFLSVIVLWFYDVLTIVLSGLFNENPILIAMAKVGIFWIVWKKRYWLLSMMTANQLSVSTRQFARRFGGVTTDRQGFGMTQVKDNALSKLSLSRRSIRLLAPIPMVGGAMTMAGAFDNGLSKRFNQKVQDKGKWLRQKAGLPESNIKEKSKRHKDGVENTLQRSQLPFAGFRQNVSQTKDYLTGHAKSVLADGYGNTPKGDRLRQESEVLLNKTRQFKPLSSSLPKDKHNASFRKDALPRQQAVNQMTKERLLANRQLKINAQPSASAVNRQTFYDKQKVLEQTHKSQTPITKPPVRKTSNLSQIKTPKKVDATKHRQTNLNPKMPSKEINVKSRQKRR
ncbi:TPA: hypothetical protein U2C09_001259 [Streptococcus suis]|nr:hypothetical protein [Streptococcus suis]